MFVEHALGHLGVAVDVRIGLVAVFLQVACGDDMSRMTALLSPACRVEMALKGTGCISHWMSILLAIIGSAFRLLIPVMPINYCHQTIRFHATF